MAAEQHYGVLLAVQSVETGNHLLRAVQGAAADEHHVLAAHRGHPSSTVRECTSRCHSPSRASREA